MSTPGSLNTQPRILICGPSGVGKSELANFIALSCGIPFITTSTKPLWEKHDIHSHKELIRKGQEDPTWGQAFQHEVLDYRRNLLEQQQRGYVCDRSPIDNLAYYMMQNSMDMGLQATESYREKCTQDLVNQAEFIIRIKFKLDYNLKDDGMRVNNPYFQAMTDGVFESIFQEDMLNIGYHFTPSKILVLDTWDWNTRIKLVQRFLKINETTAQRWLVKLKINV